MVYKSAQRSIQNDFQNPSILSLSMNVIFFYNCELQKSNLKSSPGIDPKSLPRSFKIPPTIVQNRRQNSLKSRSGGVWAALGAYRGVLVVSWCVLGLSCGALGVSWSVLKAPWEASWARFGASRGCLGRVSGASWGVLGRLGASWARLGGVLGSIFVAQGS